MESKACQSEPSDPYQPQGEVNMVDVSHKPVLFREAVARGEIRLQKATSRLIKSQKIAKGNVSARRAWPAFWRRKNGELIPLCHPLPLTHCEVILEFPLPPIGSSLRRQREFRHKRCGDGGADGRQRCALDDL
jgi:hypothetical protein